MTDIPHGTISGYSTHRCRCTECRIAKRLYQRQTTARYAARLATNPETFNHGKTSTYQLGCRCTPCRQAGTPASRAYRRRRKEQQ